MTTTVHPELRLFVTRLVGAMLMALVPVVFTAFVTLPLSLNRHPGEAPMADASGTVGPSLVATSHPT